MLSPDLSKACADRLYWEAKKGYAESRKNIIDKLCLCVCFILYRSMKVVEWSVR